MVWADHRTEGWNLHYISVTCPSVLQNPIYGHLGERQRDAERWRASYSRIFKGIRNISLIESNLKVMTRWYLTQAKLAKMYPTTDPRCFRGCQLTGSMAHIWWECPWIRSFWSRIFSLIQKVIDLQILRTPANALLNANLPKTSKYNRKWIHFILLGQVYYSQTWKKPRVSFAAAKHKISWIMSQAKLTGILLNTTAQFEATWEPWARHMGTRGTTINIIGLLWALKSSPVDWLFLLFPPISPLYSPPTPLLSPPQYGPLWKPERPSDLSVVCKQSMDFLRATDGLMPLRSKLILFKQQALKHVSFRVI